MKTLRKKIVHLVVAVIVCACLPGCWDYVAINTRAPVLGIAFDPVPDEPNQVMMTIQVPILSRDGGKSGSGETMGSSTAFQDLSIQALSVPEGLRSLQLKMNRQVDIAQLRMIVFSGHLSPETMDSVVGQLIRLPKINRLAYVLSTPESAKDILSVSGAESSPSDFFAQFYTIRQQGYSVSRELWQYWRDVTQVGVTPVLPVAVPAPTEEEKGQTLSTSGLQVYRNNKPSFSLSKAEAFDLNLMTGQVRAMAFDVPLGGSVAALTDVIANSHMSCVSQGNNIFLIDRISVSATLGKLPDPSPKPLPPTNINRMEQETSKYLTDQVTNTLKKMQQQESDVPGFGRIYFQHHPDAEALMKKSWGKMFASAKVSITVNVKIVSKGELI